MPSPDPKAFLDRPTSIHFCLWLFKLGSSWTKIMFVASGHKMLTRTNEGYFFEVGGIFFPRIKLITCSLEILSLAVTLDELDPDILTTGLFFIKE